MALGYFVWFNFIVRFSKTNMGPLKIVTWGWNWVYIILEWDLAMVYRKFSNFNVYPPVESKIPRKIAFSAYFCNFSWFDLKIGTLNSKSTKFPDHVSRSRSKDDVYQISALSNNFWRPHIFWHIAWWSWNRKSG